MTYRDAYKKLRVGMRVALKGGDEVFTVERIKTVPATILECPAIAVQFNNGAWVYHQTLRFVDKV